MKPSVALCNQPAGVEAASELRRYGVLASIQLCEAFHKVRRLQEERVLLAKELAQYLQYCEGQVQELLTRLAAVEAEQRPLAEVLGAARYHNEQRYFCASALRTAAAAPMLKRFPQAICAVLRAGIAEYSKHISLASQVVREHSHAPAASMSEAAVVQHSDSSDADSIMSDDSEGVIGL